MNPADAPSRDWSLYYNNSYMLHVKSGEIVTVRASGDHGFSVRVDGEWERVKPHELVPFWPRPRAINMGTTAGYIARRSSREARRSATSNQYYQACGSLSGVNVAVMAKLHDPDPYPQADSVFERYNKGLWTAVTTNIVVEPSFRDDGECQVYYRGTYVGDAKIDRYGLTPTFSRRAICKRTELNLEKAGLLCL